MHFCISCCADVKLSDFFCLVEMELFSVKSTDHSLRLVRRLIFMKICVYARSKDFVQWVGYPCANCGYKMQTFAVRQCGNICDCI